MGPRGHAPAEKNIDKAAVVAALRTRLRERLAALNGAQGAAQSGAIHEETRQEDPKDTRAIEASYLARGLAERVETLKDEIAAVGAMTAAAFAPDDTIAVGALVGVEDEDGVETVYFLTRHGGGEKIMVDGTSIQVLNTTSPLGRALIEKTAGDEIEVDLPTRHLEVAVAWIA